ncbi:MAG: S41 family peptidase [Acetatifactor sp.]|nr:S41 family peptidase [Acetatifactor sp.]
MKILYGLIYEMDSAMQFMYVFLLCSLIVIPVLHRFLKNHIKIWSLISMIPLAVYVVFLCKEHYVGNTELTIQRYTAFGLVALFIALYGLAIFFKRSFKAYTIIMCMTNVVILLLNIIVIWAVYLRPNVANYSALGWTDSFEKTIDYLEKEYILNEWKEIDYARIREELIPKVREAEQNHDELAFVAALYELKYEFHDGHVTVRGNMAQRNAAIAMMAGNDYGFSMFRAKTGEVVAILVDEESEAYKNGIHNGTIITKWDDVPIDEACAGVKCIDREHPFQTTENIYIGQPIFLAGQGGDQLKVTFISDDHKEMSVTLSPCGEYVHRRTQTLEILFNDKVISRDNYSLTMIDDHIGYLRIWEEEYSPDPFFITKCTIAGFSQKIYDKLDAGLEELSKQGMDRIIIDLRNNEGGNGFESRTVASLFTSNPIPHYLTLYKDGEYQVVSEAKKSGACKWDNIPIVVLVNGQTVSAGEILTHYLKGSKNVTIIGNTTTWGAAQGTGGSTVLTDSKYEFRFPITLEIGSDHLPIVDVKADGNTRLTLDYQIDYSIEELVEMFENPEKDTVLQEAIDYINEE